METDTCLTCQEIILPKTTGKTQLPCGHSFHPHCIHSYYRGSSSCPFCPVKQGAMLDFGDNVHIANATRELVYASNTPVSKGNFSWIAEKFKPKGNYPVFCGADELVNWKAPISVFLERKITAQNLSESGVKLETWFGNGYTLTDLQKMDVKWSDLVFMGFGSHMLKFVPVSFLVNVLGVDISHLLQIGVSTEHLIQAGYGAKDLLALKCTTHTLINMKMPVEQMRSFNIAEKQWKILALQE